MKNAMNKAIALVEQTDEARDAVAKLVDEADFKDDIGTIETIAAKGGVDSIKETVATVVKNTSDWKSMIKNINRH
jgi:hypothetical protein